MIKIEAFLLYCHLAHVYNLLHIYMPLSSVLLIIIQSQTNKEKLT